MGPTFPAARLKRLLRVRRVQVEGTSMVPTLQPGDRLVVVGAVRPRPGALVAVADPRRPRRLLVKRVGSLDVPGAAVTVYGDNGAESTDSRSFGPVPLAAVVGVAVYRYFPPARAGRL